MLDSLPERCVWGFDGGEKGFDHSEDNRFSGLDYLPNSIPSLASSVPTASSAINEPWVAFNFVEFSSLHEPYQRIPPAFLGQDSVA